MLLKKCTIKFHGSDGVMAKPDAVKRQRQRLSRMKVSIYHSVNFKLVAIEREAGVPGLQKEFSIKGRSELLNGLFVNRGLREILQGKDYREVYVVLPIIGSYIDRATVVQNDANMTGGHHMYSDTMSKVLSLNYGQGWSEAELEALRKYLFAFIHRVVTILLPICTSGLLTPKFHLLDHLMEEISRLKNISA